MKKFLIYVYIFLFLPISILAIGFGSPQVKWSYSLGSYTDFSPLVADIDTLYPGSEIITAGTDNGYVFCLSSSGSLIWVDSVVTPPIWSSGVVANIDGGNDYEIILRNGAPGGDIYCIDNKGNLKWSYTGGGFGPYAELSSPVIANLDGIGNPEILASGGDGFLYCLDSGGNLLWSYSLNNNTAKLPPSPVVSDLDGNGSPEILAGFNDSLLCLNYDGTRNWAFYCADSVYAGVGIADLNLDGLPEILIPSQHSSLWCLRWDGSYRWHITFPKVDNYQVVSTPAIADIDEQPDSLPEIVVYSRSNQTLYALRENSTGNGAYPIWSAEAADSSPNSATSPFLCDIDGDRDKDAVWIGEYYLGIYNGLDGKYPDSSSPFGFYKNTNFCSGTGNEHGATIADIDHDGHAEIVGIYGRTGIAVLECNSWVKCRTIAPDYLYHITEINEDLSVPTVEPSHWKIHNTWLTQLIEGGGGIEENSNIKNQNAKLEIKGNPFIKSTTLKYSLPSEAKVSLKLYDISGRCVKMLVDGTKNQGTYEEELQATGLSVGIYFIKFTAYQTDGRQAGNYQNTQKLILMR